ncbi:polysaccharide deacetylase family protein [Pseudalkalibacillus hwajinpoensis]|uniref:polysaccharide deacetylase family protein n=1 Tax=Guptibacillus hwajinpoensis TaxID=208199 RepID=UPI00325B11BF
MKKTRSLFLSTLILTGCQSQSVAFHEPSAEKSIVRSETTALASSLSNQRTLEILAEYKKQDPVEWGERVTGVKNRFITTNKEIALTFDACGGPHGSDVDEKLFTFLIDQQIPSTLFVNSRWIDENTGLFQELAAEPIFQIENHGTNHQPLSVNGRSAWGIMGTSSVNEVVQEITQNQDKITELTDKKPSLFRSGTAYYDDVSVNIANEIGVEVVNYTILGDAGATFSRDQVKDALIAASPGDIALLHANQPASETAEGLKLAVPILKKKGYSFVQLKNQNLQ